MFIASAVFLIVYYITESQVPVVLCICLIAIVLIIAIFDIKQYTFNDEGIKVRYILINKTKFILYEDLVIEITDRDYFFQPMCGIAYLSKSLYSKSKSYKYLLKPFLKFSDTLSITEAKWIFSTLRKKNLDVSNITLNIDNPKIKNQIINK